jgi:hypothetical protein
MSLSLHAALVPAWVQILNSVRGLADKAAAHCADHGIDPADLLQTRLIDDMLPLAYQFKSCTVHSRGAIEGAQKGAFSPDMSEPAGTFPAIIDRLDETVAWLSALDPASLDALEGKEVIFSIGDKLRRPYTAENFLLGFSQPNFYFHATTAYDILRMKGLPIGKRDYLGATPVTT